VVTVASVVAVDSVECSVVVVRSVVVASVVGGGSAFCFSLINHNSSSFILFPSILTHN